MKVHIYNKSLHLPLELCHHLTLTQCRHLQSPLTGKTSLVKPNSTIDSWIFCGTFVIYPIPSRITPASTPSRPLSLLLMISSITALSRALMLDQPLSECNGEPNSALKLQGSLHYFEVESLDGVSLSSSLLANMLTNHSPIIAKPPHSPDPPFIEPNEPPKTRQRINVSALSY